MQVKILHITSGLYTGGAEVMLYKLLCSMDHSQYQARVISLRNVGTIGRRIKEAGVPVQALGMSRRIPDPWSVGKLLRAVLEWKPDLIQGWMYHGNLAAQFVKCVNARSIPVLWNIRQPLYSLQYEKTTTAAVIRVSAKLSKLPAAIIYNSKIGVVHHEGIGYASQKTIIIPNGFDTALFAPSPQARHSVRTELGLQEDTFLIGLIGRYDPLKDHANFLRAAALVSKKHPHAKFLLAGSQIEWSNHALKTLIQQLDLTTRVCLLEERHDIPRLTAALDIACCSSYSEGFPNVIGEAMACGVPCVVTEVGDAGWIIGTTGLLVPPKEPESLARGVLQLIQLEQAERQRLGRAARQRIIECFSLEKVVAQYETLYHDVLDGNRAAFSKDVS